MKIGLPFSKTEIMSNLITLYWMKLKLGYFHLL